MPVSVTMPQLGETVTEARHKVKPGDSLRVVLPEAAPALPQAERMPLSIVFEDKDLIVIDKPAGLATQGGSGLTKHVDGMLDSLQYEKPTRPKLVHRLDRDTSGVLVLARFVSRVAWVSRIAFALIVGVIVATYSSIFIAAPLTSAPAMTTKKIFEKLTKQIVRRALRKGTFHGR